MAALDCRVKEYTLSRRRHTRSLCLTDTTLLRIDQIIRKKAVTTGDDESLYPPYTPGIQHQQPLYQEAMWTLYMLSVHNPTDILLADEHCDLRGYRHLSRVTAQNYPAYFPLRFGVTAKDMAGEPRQWMFQQGGDPRVLTATRSHLTDALLPLIVIRLNRPLHGKEAAIEEAFKSSSLLYGRRCGHVLHVPDFSTRIIGCRNDRRGDAQLLLDALCDRVKTLYADLFHLMMMETRDQSVRRVVYVHCRQGMERSRYLMMVLHAIFWVQAYAGRNYLAFDASPQAAVHEGLRRWAHVQALSPLLSHRKRPALVNAVAYTLGRLFGLDPAKLRPLFYIHS